MKIQVHKKKLSFKFKVTKILKSNDIFFETINNIILFFYIIVNYLNKKY